MQRSSLSRRESKNTIFAQNLHNESGRFVGQLGKTHDNVNMTYQKPKSNNSDSLLVEEEASKISKMIKEKLKLIVHFMQGNLKAETCP